MQLPTIPTRWEDVPRWAGQVNALLRSFYPRPSPDIMPSVGAGGTTHQLRVQPGRGAAAVLNSFALSDASTKTGGSVTKKIGVSNGLIAVGGALTLASGLTGLPSGMTAGGDPPYEDEVANDDNFAWIELTIDNSGDAPQVTDIEINEGATIPANSGTKLCIPLGDFDASGDTSVAIGSGTKGIGSQLVIACRNRDVDKDDDAAWTYTFGSYEAA